MKAEEAGREALRWVTEAGVAADGGVAWPCTRAPGAALADDLYYGTAGVLLALSEARLCGIADFDGHARAAAGRLRSLACTDPGAMLAGDDADDESGTLNLGLYTGLSGVAAALRMWASASGDDEAAAAARSIATGIARAAASGQPVSAWRDVLSGEAGILLTLIDARDEDETAAFLPAISSIAGRLVATAEWIDGQPDWYARAGDRMFCPNFSHGAAGIAFALGAASAALERADLAEVAELAGRRLVRLGERDDGTIVVPNSIPAADPAFPVSYGWCHGPTGTARLFLLLDRLRPGSGWGTRAEACLRAIRASGLPTRWYPGFWDNIGQCCGTAGVGELALDRYQATGDEQWLAWAASLAGDVLGRSTADAAGIRWSNTEHRRNPPDLEPYLGWMQGAAGIGAWLLRLARLERDGPRARRLRWPDQPDHPDHSDQPDQADRPDPARQGHTQPDRPDQPDCLQIG